MSMAWVAVGVIGGAVIGGATGNALSNQAGPDGRVALDINKVISDARTNAETNLKGSLDLESKYLPGTAKLRGQADTALADQLSGNTAVLKARNTALSGMAEANPLLKESSTSILESLRRGGKLDPETQNAVMRGALQQGGTAGISGSGAARGLAARDLGLTSLSLLTQRQQLASQSGSALSADAAARAGALTNAGNSDLARTAGIASLLDSRALPEYGLSANSIADMQVAENNAQNQYTLDKKKIEIAQRQQKINAILGFAGLGASMGGKIAGAGG